MVHSDRRAATDGMAARLQGEPSGQEHVAQGQEVGGAGMADPGREQALLGYAVWDVQENVRSPESFTSEILAFTCSTVNSLNLSTAFVYPIISSLSLFRSGEKILPI